MRQDRGLRGSKRQDRKWQGRTGWPFKSSMPSNFKFDPTTGKPLQHQFDPMTGQPIPKFDPMTGRQNW